MGAFFFFYLGCSFFLVFFLTFSMLLESKYMISATAVIWKWWLVILSVWGQFFFLFFYCNRSFTELLIRDNLAVLVWNKCKRLSISFKEFATRRMYSMTAAWAGVLGLAANHSAQWLLAVWLASGVTPGVSHWGEEIYLPYYLHLVLCAWSIFFFNTDFSSSFC